MPQSSLNRQSPPAFASSSERENHAQLLRRVARDRDRAAFGELFAYFAPRVKGYMLRLGADDGQAEELAQETMILVWRKAELFDERQASLSTWIFRIARNRRVDAFRATHQSELDAHDPAFAPASSDTPSEAMDVREAEERIRIALSNLPPEQLDIVRMAFYQGLTHRAIAERLNLPIGTVKGRIRLAFQKLRERVQI